jgi:YD repeat-containing protein
MGGSTTTQTVYNCNGMPVTKIDGKGYQTQIAYDSSGLFANTVQRPTTGTFTHIDSYSHDLYTSELLSHTDENSQTTSYTYDVMGRVTSITYPDVIGSTHGGTTFCYTDIGGTFCPKTTAPFSLYTSTTTGSSPASPITTTHTYDGWGRQYFSSITSDPGQIATNTTYDWAGRVVAVTNPVRSNPLPNDPPAGTTSYTYDALGRKTIQTQPDGSAQQWCYDGIGTYTSPNGTTANCPSLKASSPLFTATAWTDIFDETGQHTQQVFDALGHMGTVFEPDPVSGSLALETDYTYDAFGDLLKVNQTGTSGSTPVVRSFAYDMPSRVAFACNPEAITAGLNCAPGSGAGTHYYYDANSNLQTKTDNRGVVTNYAYDALNRLLSKTYSGNTSGTASSCYQYDGAPSTTTNLSGRLVAEWTQSGACPKSLVLPSSGIQTVTTISAYDAMGRLQNEQRCMGVADCASTSGGYAMNYTYDLTGKLLTYPSGYGTLTFTNTYDAVGRLSSVVQGAGPSSLFSAHYYTPAGSLSGASFGSLSMNRTFDNRQRVTGETDQGTANIGNVNGTATITILGSEQSK